MFQSDLDLILKNDRENRKVNFLLKLTTAFTYLLGGLTVALIIILSWKG